MRLTLAPISALTDARGNNEKARTLSAWRQQGRAVVSLLLNATGVSALTPAPVFTLTHPVERTQPKLPSALYHSRMGQAISRLTHEHSPVRETGSNH